MGQTRSWPHPDALTHAVSVVVSALAAVAEAAAAGNVGAVSSDVKLRQPSRTSAISASSPPLVPQRGGFGSEPGTVSVPELKTVAFMKLSEPLKKLVPVGTATFSCFSYSSAMPLSV